MRGQSLKKQSFVISEQDIVVLMEELNQLIGTQFTVDFENGSGAGNPTIMSGEKIVTGKTDRREMYTFLDDLIKWAREGGAPIIVRKFEIWCQS